MSSELWLGYVVEDDMLEPTKHKEEANMDKHIGDVTEMVRPRICEVLGVEVGERFDVKSEIVSLYTDAYISEDGIARTKSITPIDSMRLCEIINGELKIIRKPRWTEQDVEDAKTVRRVFGRDGTIERHSKTMTVPYSPLTFDHLYINEDLFPSIKPGQSYTLQEIIGGAE